MEDAEKEKDTAVSKDYFRRNEQKVVQPISLLSSIIPDDAETQQNKLEKKAKSAILKGMLGSFDF